MLTTSRVFSFSERASRGSLDLSDVNLLRSQHVCMRPLSVVIFCTFLWSSDPLDTWMPTLIQSLLCGSGRYQYQIEVVRSSEQW